MLTGIAVADAAIVLIRKRSSPVPGFSHTNPQQFLAAVFTQVARPPAEDKGMLQVERARQQIRAVWNFRNPYRPQSIAPITKCGLGRTCRVVNRLDGCVAEASDDAV